MLMPILIYVASLFNYTTFLHFHHIVGHLLVVHYTLICLLYITEIMAFTLCLTYRHSQIIVLMVTVDLSVHAVQNFCLANHNFGDNQYHQYGYRVRQNI